MFDNSSLFEEAIFDKSRANEGLANHLGTWTNFSDDIHSVLLNSSPDLVFPETQIGSVLYFRIKKYLNRMGVGSEGLRLLPAVGTLADIHQKTDGFVYLPELHQVVTLDAFNCPPEVLVDLRQIWIDSFPDQNYTEVDFQSDLFRYKEGLRIWMKKNTFQGVIPARFSVDFRKLSTKDRPENHFVITPWHVGSNKNRRSFSKQVAGYFLKVSSHKNSQAKP